MVTRSGLPQDFIFEPGVLLDGFEATGDWTKTGTGTMEADAVNVLHGSSSIKLTTGTNITMTRNISTNIDFSVIRMWCYVEDVSKITTIYVYLSSHSSLTTYYVYSISNTYLVTGWNLLTIRSQDWSNVNDAKDALFIRLRVKIVASSSTYVSFDEIRYGVHVDRHCLIWFDNSLDTVYTNAYPYMKARGVVGTVAVITDSVGESGYLTEAQMDEMYADGWAMSNHTKNHTQLGPLETVQANVDVLEPAQEWLLARYPRAALHLAFPSGMSSQLTYDAMDQLGILTGRSVVSIGTKMPWLDLHCINGGYGLKRTVTVAQYKAYIDGCMSLNYGCWLYGHGVATPAGDDNTQTIEDFQWVIDYLIANHFRFLTIDEWYEGRANPRYRSLPLTRV